MSASGTRGFHLCFSFSSHKDMDGSLNRQIMKMSICSEKKDTPTSESLGMLDSLITSYFKLKILKFE